MHFVYQNHSFDLTVANNLLVQVYRDDIFEDILAVIRGKFSDTDGSLHIADLVKNEPITRIDTWTDLRAAADFLPCPGRPFPKHWDFVLVSSCIS